MKRVYIAGPFRGPDAWAVECNIREAEALGFRVASMGAVPVIPHAMFRFFDRTLTDQFWIDATLELLRACDTIVLTPRWEMSAGARGELNEARTRGLPVFFAPGELPALATWIRGG